MFELIKHTFLMYLLYITGNLNVLDIKYRGKEFNLQDLNNENKFNESELKYNIDWGFYVYNYKTLDLIHKCASIVKENKNFTMLLDDNIGERYGTKVLIKDNLKNLTYSIDWINKHHYDKICIYYTTLGKKVRKYCINELDNIDFFFDIKNKDLIL